VPAGWQAERTRLLATLRRRPVTTATAVAQRAAQDEAAAGDRPARVRVDPGWPPSPMVEWDHADGPRQVGRAVHGVLADLDLATGCDASGRSLDEVAQARARAQGVADHASDLAAMVRRALSSPTVTHGASRRHWREVFVTVPVGPGGVLEGFVDLLVEDEDGLVVVDYKTDRLPGESDRHAAVTTYRLQVAAYAAALETATGTPVARCVLVFVGAEEPWEDVLEGEDLAVAVSRARAVADALVTT